jgi:2-iminobutanoate/2-iminopropanoate deaminase
LNAPQIYDGGISHKIGRYSDAIRVPAGYDQIVVSGTPGIDENGNIPADFADEARQAWRNVVAILEEAGASITDIVSIRQYLTREEDIKTYVAVQQEFLTHEPTGMLLVPTAMVWPEINVEVEAVALVPRERDHAPGG